MKNYYLLKTLYLFGLVCMTYAENSQKANVTRDNRDKSNFVKPIRGHNGINVVLEKE